MNKSFLPSLFSRGNGETLDTLQDEINRVFREFSRGWPALPGSFAGPSDFTRESAVYFSFVTLATLGCEDFLPQNDMTRGFVVFEVIGGQLFLAVMVARLIGLYTSERKSD